MKLSIYLGSKCNLNCKYCHRIADTTEKSVVSDKLINYIKSISNDKLTIRFMGGEPTLYFDSIKQIVDLTPKAKFSICTNGKDLYKYIDYFREHKFNLCISYDANDECNLRGYDPFTSLINYPFISVSTTIYHGNTDLKKIIKKLNKKELIIGKRLTLFPHIIHNTGEYNKQYALTKEDAISYITQFKEIVTSYMNDYFKYGIINIRYRAMFYQLFQRYNFKFKQGESYCVGYDSVKCDLNGNFYDCLYIRDDKLSETNYVEAQYELIKSRFPNCLKCSVYDMCGGACIKSKDHGIECLIYNSLYTWFKIEYEKWRSIYGDYR